LKTAKPIMTKKFTGLCTMNATSWVGPYPPTNTR